MASTAAPLSLSLSANDLPDGARSTDAQSGTDEQIAQLGDALSALMKTPSGAVQFVQLPQEVRDNVYLKMRSVAYIDIMHMPNRLRPPPITKVSHRIREESLHVYYEKEHFMVDLRGWLTSAYPASWTPTHVFSKWVTAIGDNVARLRRVTFVSHKFSVSFQAQPEAQPPVAFNFRSTQPAPSPSDYKIAPGVPGGYSYADALKRAQKHLEFVADQIVRDCGSRPLRSDDMVKICETIANLEPCLCTYSFLGFKGAVLSADASKAPYTLAHKAGCDRCSTLIRS